MAVDLATLSDQDRALIAQYLAAKGGADGEAPLLLRRLLASLDAGGNLYDLVLREFPDGIPTGVKWRPYLSLLGGTPAVAPQQPSQPFNYGIDNGEQGTGIGDNPSTPKGNLLLGILNNVLGLQNGKEFTVDLTPKPDPEREARNPEYQPGPGTKPQNDAKNDPLMKEWDKAWNGGDPMAMPLPTPAPLDGSMAGVPRSNAVPIAPTEAQRVQPGVATPGPFLSGSLAPEVSKQTATAVPPSGRVEGREAIPIGFSTDNAILYGPKLLENGQLFPSQVSQQPELTMSALVNWIEKTGFKPQPSRPSNPAVEPGNARFASPGYDPDWYKTRPQSTNIVDHRGTEWADERQAAWLLQFHPAEDATIGKMIENSGSPERIANGSLEPNEGSSAEPLGQKLIPERLGGGRLIKPDTPSDALPFRNNTVTTAEIEEWLNNQRYGPNLPPRSNASPVPAIAAALAQTSSASPIASERIGPTRISTAVAQQVPGGGYAQRVPAQRRVDGVEPAPVPAAAGPTIEDVLAREAVNDAAIESGVVMDDLTKEYYARVAALEVDPRIIDAYGFDVYKQQVKNTAQVYLNRQGSGRYGDTAAEMFNARNQFSPINGPRNRKYPVFGKVENVPPEKAGPDLRRILDEFYAESASGAPSPVGGALNYANPGASDPANQGWIRGMQGLVKDDAGPFSQWYGTPKGQEPFTAKVAASGIAVTPEVEANRASWLTGARAAEAAKFVKRSYESAVADAIQTAAVSPAIGHVQQQTVRAPGGAPITVAQRNAMGGYSAADPVSSGGGSSSTVGSGKSTSKTQPVTAPTGGKVTTAQRDAIGGYTTPKSPTTATKSASSTSGNQKVTSSSGGSLTVSQRNAFGGY